MATRKTTTTRAARRSNKPDPQIAAIKFEGIQGSDPESFTAEWDHARGFRARLAATILELNDQQLEQKMFGSAEVAHAAMDAHDDFRREIEYLKVHIEMLDKVCARILCVAHRVPPHIRDAKQPGGAA